MASTSRELVYQTLNFEGPARAPRQLWLLQWASDNYPAEVVSIQNDYPCDFGHVSGHLSQTIPTRGEPFRRGTYTDEWGVSFVNVQDGVQGEVKDPIVRNWKTDREKISIPRAWLTIDAEKINRDIESIDKFVMSGPCPRPFEQLQFVRGTEDLYMDLLDPPDEMLAFVKELHEFYCDLLEAWAATDIDGITFMDDWGSQQALLISPAVWREVFKPMYRDFIQIAHASGKKAFMHSDGHILELFPDLIEIGLDAVNSQIFCMGVESLRQFAGKITFWGEIDRQHILPSGTTLDVDRAVVDVYSNLWSNGGCIAQCEFGAGARPANVRQVFESWDRISSR